jgi:cytochrome oxidase Cu insertion factor (SCO1/SenC/PrrC family)
MNPRWTWLLAAATLALVACQAAGAGGPPSAAGAPAAAAGPSARELRVGDTAPDFTLADQNRQNVTLSQFRGRAVQVAFYVYAFSGG